MKIALCCLVLLAGLSARQQAFWRDNVTLWTHAVAVEPTLARPAINLAVAHRVAGRFGRAAAWIERAWPLTAGDAREADYRTVIRREVNYLAIVGIPLCNRDTLPSYC